MGVDCAAVVVPFCCMHTEDMVKKRDRERDNNTLSKFEKMFIYHSNLYDGRKGDILAI